jgi:transposase InsO family protein
VLRFLEHCFFFAYLAGNATQILHVFGGHRRIRRGRSFRPTLDLITGVAAIGVAVTTMAQGERVIPVMYAVLGAYNLHAWWNDDDTKRRRRKLKDKVAKVVTTAGGLRVVVPQGA